MSTDHDTPGCPAGDAPANEAAIILRTLTALIEPLASVLPGDSEVVLHELAKLPDSIVAIAGDLSGRPVGGPATDLLLRAGAQGVYTTAIGYRSRHPDGRELRSSTIIVRDSAGTAVAALCVNSDTRNWALLADLARSMLPAGSDDAVASESEESENLIRDVDDLATDLLSRAISSVDVPVELMQKRHKVAVVANLKDRGFFLLKESVETAAQALGVTRFTIYNYLSEVERGSSAS